MSRSSEAEHRDKRELARLIYEWHTSHLPSLRSCSPHTVRAYRTSLTLYATYLMEVHSITPYNLSSECFSVKTVEEWRRWLKDERGCGNDTCNQRLAAIRSLLRFIGSRAVQYASLYISVNEHVKPLRADRTKVNGMSREAVKAILAAPDPNTRLGLRDIALMMMCYGVAARINEVLSLRINCLHLDVSNPFVTVYGKGGAYRSIYLQEQLVCWLRRYLSVFHGDNPSPDDYLFYSPCKGIRGKLTQPAVAKRLRQHALKAHEKCPEVPLNLHSHLWRHSMACHWREDHINIVEIKELLGHRSLQSTMVYQDVTEKQKLDAIETLGDTVTKAMIKKWKLPSNKDLLTMLGL